MTPFCNPESSLQHLNLITLQRWAHFLFFICYCYYVFCILKRPFAPYFRTKSLFFFHANPYFGYFGGILCSFLATCYQCKSSSVHLCYFVKQRLGIEAPRTYQSGNAHHGLLVTTNKKATYFSLKSSGSSSTAAPSSGRGTFTALN